MTFRNLLESLVITLAALGTSLLLFGVFCYVRGDPTGTPLLLDLRGWVRHAVSWQTR